MAAPKAHVKRIYATNPDGSTNQDVWIDVLRMDTFPNSRRGSADGHTETNTAHLFWKDNTAENQNTKRTTRKIQVQNPTDTNQSIDLWVVDRLTLAGWGQNDGQNRQNTTITFDKNVATNTRRRTTTVRVPHNDLGNATWQNGIDWTAYQQLLAQGNEDTTQYVDVEITNTFALNLKGAHDGLTSQATTFDITANKAVAALFPLSPGNVNGVQTDPLQTIVNVSWAAPPMHLLASTVTGMYGSKDGFTWYRAATGVEVMSLAYADGIWIGFNTFQASLVASYDGARTWTNIRTVFGTFGGQVAATKPKGNDADGNPLPAIYAVWSTDDAFNTFVQTSRNQTASWVTTLVIPSSETPMNMQGAGDAIFLTTTEITDLSTGAAVVRLYLTGDGIGWSQITVFGPESGVQGGGVGYDPQTKRYILTASKFVSGGLDNLGGSLPGSYNIRYKISTNPTFPVGYNEIAAASPPRAPVDNFHISALAAAGGGGGFATSFFVFTGQSPEDLGTDVIAAAVTIPGAISILKEQPSTFHGAPCDHTCFAGKNPGVFACLVVGFGFSGIFIANPGGGWVLSTPITAFQVDPNTNYIGAALGAGIVSFIP